MRGRRSINGGAVAGWIMAKTGGISFIDGLEEAEGAQFADTTAMVLAAVAVLAAVVALIWRNPQSWYGSWAFTATAVVVAVVTGLAMVSAGSHTHAHGAAATRTRHERRPAGPAGPATRTPRPSCRPRSTTRTSRSTSAAFPASRPQQQARAENLIAITLLRLPQWKDPAYAEAHGFHSIGDGFTGDEHFINTAFFDDGRILDPDHPESLVYDTRSGKRVLESAMFMLAPGDSFADIPDVGGPLTQWHIHDNLCFTTAGNGGRAHERRRRLHRAAWSRVPRRR